MSKLTAQDLAQFTGTTRYYRIGRQHLLTDGTYYLAAKAGCYWLMDAVSSHVAEIGTRDWFIVGCITSTQDRVLWACPDFHCSLLSRYSDTHGVSVA